MTIKSVAKIIIIISFIILSFTACNHVKVDSEDYTVKYKNTLDAMFGDNWTVKYTEKEKVIPESDGDDGAFPFIYTKWGIQYTDINNETQVFILNNRDPLSEQIGCYIEEYVSKYYEQHFFNKYLKNIPIINGASYIDGFFINYISVDPDINKEKDMKVHKYSESLEVSSSTICFTKFTPANAFEMCPMYLSINISIDDGKYATLEKQNIEQLAIKQVELMITDMNKYANNMINVEISLCSNQCKDVLYNGDDKRSWYYINGRSKYVSDPFCFELDVYDGYIGLFW